MAARRLKLLDPAEALAAMRQIDAMNAAQRAELARKVNAPPVAPPVDVDVRQPEAPKVPRPKARKR